MADLKIPKKTVDDYFVLKEFQDDFNALNNEINKVNTSLEDIENKIEELKEGNIEIDLSDYATKDEINRIDSSLEDKVDRSGHTANMYLGTDSNGKVVTVDTAPLVEDVITALSGETTESGIISDNKFDGVFNETGKINTATGENANASTLHRTSGYLDLGKTISGDVYYAISEALTGSFGICIYDENKSFIVGTQHPSGYAAGLYSVNTGADVKARYFRVYAPISWTGQVYVSYVRPSSFENIDYTYEYSEGGTTGGANITVNIQKPFTGQTIVNFGDSIFGKRRPPEDISTRIAELTGATVYNCGFGGCHMTNHFNTNTYNAFSMCNLADAVVTGNWDAQDSAIKVTGSTAVPSYFSEGLSILKELDFNKVDIITIAYGTNDWNSGDAIDNQTNSLNKDCFASALRYSIETLLGAYPHLKIFICSQTYRFWIDDNGNFTEDSDTKVNDNSVKLTDFVAKTKEVAEQYHLPFIDNYYSLGFNKFNRGYYFNATDGTHPRAVGCRLIAEHIANELF